MKIEIKQDATLDDETIIIYCKEMNEIVQQLKALIEKSDQDQSKVQALLDGKEFHLYTREILFFETEADTVYAHTKSKQFEMRERLYELEKTLPYNFMRISKSTILNVSHVYAVEKSIGGPREITFRGTDKTVFVSRKYYPVLKERF